jgi:L-lactate dehydrogenase complex protein LldF
MGISGANFLIAETGSALIVTNEGNGRLATTLPRVHVAITGIEKVVPTLEDAATLLRLLPRSATGQDITNYVSLLTGVKGANDSDGPEHFHIVLLDNGRSELLGTKLQPMLRCIRCGACMNHCPVYQNIGGHAYGWVYPGPMGSVLTPSLVGLENALPLPNASTLCGRCAEVCPVNIPLPDLLRELRHVQQVRGLRPWQERLGLRVWKWLALRPGAYRVFSALAARVLKAFGDARGQIRSLPGAKGWTAGRDLPAPAGQTFHALYGRRRKQ